MISRTYFAVTSFLLFIFFTLSIIFIVLQSGLSIKEISLQNVKIKELYIKWNENIDVSAKEIQITNSIDNNTAQLDLNNIISYVKQISPLHSVFEKITLQKINYDGIDISLQYQKGSDGYLTASSSDFIFDSSITSYSNIFHMKINKYNDFQRDIKANGNIIFNTAVQNLTSTIRINVHNEIILDILVHANEDKLYYKVNSINDIPSIFYTMELLNLHKDLKYWAYKAIDFSSLEIHNAYGWIDFSNVANAYKNIYASATGKNLSYAYHKDLDAIHTKTTELEFKNGVLYIYPKQATTYASQLGQSWLKIDFTTPQETLTLQLLFDGQLDKDTLGILETFKIKVPFLQNSGQTNVDLTLVIDLQTIDIDSQGVFFTPTANFTYAGLDIDVVNTKIILDNYDIEIKNMIASYENMIDCEVDVAYNAKSSQGILDFTVTQASLNAIGLKLDTQNNNLKALYTISSKKDTLKINKSNWNLQGNTINVDEMVLPINLSALEVIVPQTEIFSKELAKMYISGHADLDKMQVLLDVNVKDVYLETIKLKNDDNYIKIKYDESLLLTTKDRLDFQWNSEKSFINPITLEMKNNQLLLSDTYLNIGNLLKTKISADYNINTQKGHFKTRRTRFSTKEFGLLYFNKESVKFDLAINEDLTTITSKDLDILFTQKKNMWELSFTSISLLALRSELLKKYHINDGSMLLTKKANEENIAIDLQLKYPYPLIVKNNIELYDYHLKGSFNTKNKLFNATLNDNLDIKIKDTIDIEARDIGINMNAIVDLKNSITYDSQAKSDIQVKIDAWNSYVYISEDRHALSDEMYLYYENEILTAGILYKEGVSGLKYEDDVFHAYGENFNDEFMDQLFALSDFEGGELGFNLSGNTKKYEGIFTVKDTIIIDYKVLNNVLAFVNTIPSLVTLSAPGYNAKGLHLKNAYMKFMAEDDIFTMSDIYFNSPELDILGNGTASFKTNDINVTLQLKTDIGSSVSQVPVVGYLFFDGDSLSTTLDVTGKLDNPTVNTRIAKEVVVAPLNFLLRTLTLPYYLITNDDDNETSKVE